jgi:flagellar biogenesis protein FliO
MTDVGFGDLLLRMLLSLAVVLGIVFGAYAILRRRQGSTGTTRVSLGDGRRSRTVSPRRGLKIIARAGLGRTSQVVAVQFADRVYLLGASDQAAPSVIAEMTVADWESATTDDDAAVVRASSTSAGRGGAAPANLLEALREATVRRA